MRERPILFSAPMVRAILDGRKTQTRRIVKPQPCEGGSMRMLANTVAVAARMVALKGPHDLPSWVDEFCPYGRHGDRLWVQEEHRIVKGGFHVNQVEYKEGGAQRECLIDNREMKLLRARKFPFAWTRGRFMYRSFSRITLEIVSVRVERLQEISEADALAEGIRSFTMRESCGDSKLYGVSLGQAEHGTTARCGYEILWESINGPGSWAANPWVWAVEFRRVAP